MSLDKWIRDNRILDECSRAQSLLDVLPPTSSDEILEKEIDKTVVAWAVAISSRRAQLQDKQLQHPGSNDPHSFSSHTIVCLKYLEDQLRLAKYANNRRVAEKQEREEEMERARQLDAQLRRSQR